MNKLALLVKDEEGMTLVELLAVIVILSIVAAIGGVAIAGVIQRSREDGRVADVQMLYEAATLAEASDSYISKTGGGTTPATPVTATMLNTQGYATTISFLKDANNSGSTADSVTFKLDAPTVAGGASRLIMSIPQNVTYAGSKANKPLGDQNASQVKAMTRTDLF